MRNYLLAIIPMVLSIGLLVALRVNTPPQHAAVLLDGTEIVTRGHDLKTGDGEFRAYTIGSTTIYLAEKTTLTLEDASTNTPKLALREGRVVTTGPVDISIRSHIIHSEIPTTYIFYSWLDKLEVHALDGSLNYTLDTLHDDALPVQTQTFNKDGSSAKDFYDWALNKVQS